jgi:hypothetical protein
MHLQKTLNPFLNLLITFKLGLGTVHVYTQASDILL